MIPGSPSSWTHLTTANELVALGGCTGPQFTVDLVGLRPTSPARKGLQVPVTNAADCPTPDVVVVPALGYKLPGPLQQALGRDDVAEAVTALRGWAADGARIAAACIGTFVLAESGLLDAARRRPPPGG